MSLQANLDKDVIVSPANEYEVLQLLLSDCRDRLTNFNSMPSCRGSRCIPTCYIEQHIHAPTRLSLQWLLVQAPRARSATRDALRGRHKVLTCGQHHHDVAIFAGYTCFASPFPNSR